MSQVNDHTLKVSEEGYRALFDAIEEGFCIVEMIFGPDGKPTDFLFLAVNRAFEKQTGLKEAAGKRMREMHAAHEQHWFDIFAQVALTGEPVRFTERAEALDRWFEVSAFRLGDKERLAIIFKDVTERRRAEEALREREEQLRRIFESATEYAIIVTGPDRNVAAWNSGAERLLGYTEEEIQGRSADVLFTKEDQAAGEPNREAENATRFGRAADERWHVRKDGSRFWASGFMFALRDDSGSLRGYLKIMRDRTAEQRGEDAVRQSEERLRVAVESAQLGTWEYDLATGQVTANARCRELFDLALDAPLAYESFFNAIHPEDQERVHANVQRTVSGATGGEYHDEYRTVAASGTERWIRATGRAYFTADGKLRRFVGTVLEITRLMQAREELERTVEQRTAQLRDTVQQLETFSYSVVHDMRAPLRSMRSFANVLNEEYAPRLDDKARAYLARVIASADRMDALITDVLSYSRVSSVEATPMRVDLDRLVHEIVEQYPQFHEVSDSVRIQSPIPAVLGNRALLTQCVSNLLGNALKFIAPGTKPKVTIRGEPKPGTVRLWVEDNGIGIKEEYQDRIFGLFHRLHRVDEYPGTGVGLAIVKKAVERMRGTIGVESEAGRGSRFWIELPAASSTAGTQG